MSAGHVGARRSRPRLLVVGASTMRDHAFAVWRELGLEIVLADGYSGGRYEHLVHHFVALDPRDGSAAVTELTELARTCDGVVTLADNSQLTAAQVAHDAGLPGIGPEIALIARSKLLQRRVGERRGLSTPRWRQVSGADDLDAFYDGRSGWSVLKPVDCAGSAGVLQVADAAEARRQWPVVRSLSPSRTVVIEEFVGGREVCVDAVVLDGVPAFVSVCDAEYVGPDGFIAVSATYAAVQPDRETATSEIGLVADAYGLRDGVMQAEFKIDDGRWTLLEVTFRPGGALVPELTERVTGIDLYEAQAQLALGRTPPLPEPDAAWSPVPFAEVRFLVGSGPVRRFVPPATVIAGLPDVKIVNQLVLPGQRARLPVSEEGRAGYAVGWGADRDRLDRQLREATGRLGREMGIVEHPDRRSEAAHA
ncbi:acetyl-CoA carboxylase biotin carboxylase subunit family protein [Actinomadura syzygii]|uniref:ATP-grasp domain-containing protein n=1 Tax=Actinomadura syzygii TaxID=1427538 RepID=A0A5D0TYE7_9ACTN|nr:ATP-grasp domain-containing protein [Actinomadura syzygii]TYC10332.1 ATP-grasp domain-containing protein [Actinomadura syzygii]